MSFGMPAGPSSAVGRLQKGTLLGGPHRVVAQSLLAVVLTGPGQPTKGELALLGAPMQEGGDPGDVRIQLSVEVPLLQEPLEGRGVSCCTSWLPF